MQSASIPRILIVGGGVGGLAAAVDLAARGLHVTLCEAAAEVGGKLRTVAVEGRAVDAGPTVLTLRRVFDQLWADAGHSLPEHLDLRQAQILARHAWPDGARLDLHADPSHSREEIARVFGEAEARGFDRFRADTAAIYEEVEGDFIFAQRPTMMDIARRYGLSGLRRLSRIDAHRTLWRATGSYFTDPRLRQLFGRYATYTGASPFQAPATLNLVAHVEQAGVWYLRGGMSRLAQGLGELARELGVELRTGAAVEEILVEGGAAVGLRLADGQELRADAIIVNADANALASGRLGPAVARAVAPIPPARRSLSALTLALVARPQGLPLVHHNVCFGPDYSDEFRRIFEQGRLPNDPTVYLCAQDRADEDAQGERPEGERVLLIINAPANGDMRPLPETEVSACVQSALQVMRGCGLSLEIQGTPFITRPQDWDRLFPATGGALYGAAPHGMMSSFERNGATTRVRALYLCGGSAHPGAGVPMAALSGRFAAQALAQDLHWTQPFRGTATPGGTSTS